MKVILNNRVNNYSFHWKKNNDDKKILIFLLFLLEKPFPHPIYELSALKGQVDRNAAEVSGHNFF